MLVYTAFAMSFFNKIGQSCAFALDADSGHSRDTADDPRVDPEQAEQIVEEVCEATRREGLFTKYRRLSPHGARSRLVAEG